MVIDTLDFLVSSTGIQVTMIPVQYPVTGSQSIVNSFIDATKDIGPVAFCVFDHISSMVRFFFFSDCIVMIRLCVAVSLVCTGIT